jgi:hypothetical protein
MITILFWGKKGFHVLFHEKENTQRKVVFENFEAKNMR